MSDFEYKQSLIEEKNSISSHLPWLIAIELHTTVDLEGYEKIVSDSQDFIWKDANDQEITFKRFPFNMGALSFNASGKFPNISVNLFNTAFLVKKVEGNSGFLGMPITLYFVNVKATSEYNSETYPLKYNFVINDCKIGQYIQFTLGSPNYLLRNLPSKRYYRDFCPYEYRQEFCWMKNFNPTGDDLKCDKSWDQCVEFKKRYNPTMRGVPYGGFPNLSKGNVYYY
jgi:hypothetical protein